MRIAYENTIPLPPERVFPWIAEPEKAMKWQKNVKGAEIIVNKPGVVGTTFRETIEEDGNRLEMQGAITKYIPNSTIGFHLASRIHELDVSYCLQETEGKTKLSIQAIIRWKFPMNIISVFAGKKMQEGLVSQLASETRELAALCRAA